MEDDKREDLKLKKRHYKMVREEEAILDLQIPAASHYKQVCLPLSDIWP